VGQLSCKVCGQTFQTGINYLSAAVDVYSEWIDACDSVAKDNAAGGGNRPISSSYRNVEGGHADDDGDDGIDRDLDDEDLDDDDGAMYAD